MWFLFSVTPLLGVDTVPPFSPFRALEVLGGFYFSLSKKLIHCFTSGSCGPPDFS
jgi:hypothetical protein